MELDIKRSPPAIFLIRTIGPYYIKMSAPVIRSMGPSCKIGIFHLKAKYSFCSTSNTALSKVAVLFFQEQVVEW